MLSWFQYQNQFFLFEKIVNSFFGFLLLILFFKARQYTLKRSKKILDEQEKLFLSVSFISIIIQVGYNFFYPFTFLLYAQSFFFKLSYILQLRQTFIVLMIDAKKSNQNQLWILINLVLIGAFILTIIQIFDLRSSNQCGQNLFKIEIIFMLFIFFFNSICLIKCIQNLKFINEKLRSMINLKEQAKNQDDLIYKKKILFIVGILALPTKILMIYLKYSGKNYFECINVFANQNTLIKILISILDYISENLLNIVVYYIYYWKNFRCKKSNQLFELIND